MKFKGPFEASLSKRAQFELLTLVVWASWLGLVITVVARWQHVPKFAPLILLPLVHLLPWIDGTRERSNLIKQHQIVPTDTKDTCQDCGGPCLQSLLRVLWGAYSALIIAELVALWR